MNIIDYPDQEMLAINLANILAGRLRATLDHEDRALLVVPGGSTPGPMSELTWARSPATARTASATMPVVAM